MQYIKRLCYNKDMKKKTYKKGFTMVELTLSMIFISILSITVVLLIQNTTSSYRRGVILGQVNTVGMDLIDELRTSVQNASSYPVTRLCEIYYGYSGNEKTANMKACEEDNANSFVSVTRVADVTVEKKEIGELPVYGAFCTGTYTYVWNSGYFENADNVDFLNTDTDKREVKYKDLADGGQVKTLERARVGIKKNATTSFEIPDSLKKYEYNARLLKIYDSKRSICINAMREYNGTLGKTEGGIGNYTKNTKYLNTKSPQFVIDEDMLGSDKAEDDDMTVELLASGSTLSNNGSPNDLVLYELYVAKPALSSTRENQFYAASFILGTRRGGINIKEAGNNCKPPSDEFTELEYCAINKFNFAVQAGGK